MWNQLGNNPWQGTYYPNTQNYAQPRTNKILVTSLEEAIAKSGELGSEMYYFDQTKPLIYVVKTDMVGAKSWAQLAYSTEQQTNNAPATRADVAALASRIEALLSKLDTVESKPSRKKKVEAEVTENVESDG